MKLLMLLKPRKRRDQDLDEEIRAHLAMAIRERIEQGEDPAEAEANAAGASRMRLCGDAERIQYARRRSGYCLCLIRRL
ncbi:MAG: permease prefix domain 1-containing protein [Terriglobia bacterium]